MNVYKEIGKGLVEVDKVRIYHHLWGKFLPSIIKLNWNDDDAMPFVCYLDEKVRLLFGSSDERHPDLYSKMERLRFNYPDILLQGRVWKRRKMMVVDQFYYSNRLSKYGSIADFLKVAGHYVEDICEYSLIFKESESSNRVYMDCVKELEDKCLWEENHVPIHTLRKMKSFSHKRR